MYVRKGLNEMLELLGEFCEIYAYSHGLKHYILEVLKKLDPDQKWFTESRVWAPASEEE